MNRPQKLVRTQKKTFSAHHMLMNAAFLQLEVARETETNRFNNLLAALTLSALSVEALANSVGDCVVSDWKDFESLNPIGKLRLLAEKLSIEFDRKAEPWATVCWLGIFRNRIAHAKPEELLEIKPITQEKLDKSPFTGPLSKLERDVTEANAARAVDAVYALKNLLCSKLTTEQAFGICIEAWMDSSSPA
jgi:hypothetical protein